jgi:hypothetical protein
MAEKDRAKSRYGEKSKSKSKSHKDKNLDDWDSNDAKAYMNSKEGQEHMAKIQRAQQLMQQDQAPDQAQAPAQAAPGLAMQQPAAPAA